MNRWQAHPKPETVICSCFFSWDAVKPTLDPTGKWVGEPAHSGDLEFICHDHPMLGPIGTRQWHYHLHSPAHIGQNVFAASRTVA